MSVVEERHAVADEDVVFDRHSLTDERVARDPAPPPDFCIFLNFDEGADLRLVADLAAVQVDEFRRGRGEEDLDVSR
jgi:hypothetical protein